MWNLVTYWVLCVNYKLSNRVNIYSEGVQCGLNCPFFFNWSIIMLKQEMALVFIKPLHKVGNTGLPQKLIVNFFTFLKSSPKL